MKKDSRAEFKPDYLVRKDKPGTFIVTKWEGNERPTAVYTVTETNRGLSCNCPGSNRDKNCKHIQLVKEHMKKSDSTASISKWSQDGKMHSFTYISKAQLVEACKEANIEIRDGKIAKADLEKIMAKYNPHGEVNDYGFGNQDLSHPVYHDEGRLMGWNSDVRTKTDLKTFIAGLKKLLLDAERADSKGANLVVVSVSSTNNNSGYLSAVFYDVNDTLEEYRKFVEKFKAEKGREPRLSEIKY